MAQYDGTIRINTKIDSGGFLKGLQKMSSQSKKLNNSISETTNQIDRLKKEISELQNAPVESSSINKISADIDTIENKLASLYEKRGILEEEVADMFGGVGSKMIPDQAFLQSMMKNNGEWKKLTADIDKTELSLEKYENKLKQAQATEQKKTDNQITRKSVQLEKACNKLDVYKTKLSEINGSESGIAKKLSHISDVAKGSFGNLTKHASKSNNTLNKLSGSITRFGKRVWGLLSSVLVFPVLTKAFTTLKEKMAAAVKQNAQFSTSLSKISGNMNSAFNNLLSAAMPALNAIISAIAKATSYLSTFVALLTGKTVKSSNAAADAADNQASAVGGVGEAAKKASEYLNGYDEMNVQASKDSASSGSGGGGIGSDITYEDTDVSSQVAVFLDRIKEAWEDADFTDFGRIVGDKINDSLEDIDWIKIRNTSYKIGESVATFLNGVFETPDLFTNVGETVAESLNTAIELSLGFAENFHWDSFGQVLADSINGFFDTFEFDKLGQAVHDWIAGGLTAATTFLKNTDFESIGEKIGEFLENLDSDDLAAKFANLFWEAIKSGAKLVKGLFEEDPIEASLMTAFSVLTFTNLGNLIATKIGTSIATAFTGGAIGTTLVTAFTTDLPLLFGAGTFAECATAIVGGFAAAVAAAFLGWNLGQFIYECITGEDTDDIDWEDYLGENFHISEWGNAIKQLIIDAAKNWNPIQWIYEAITGKEHKENAGFDFYVNFIGKIDETIQKMKDWFENKSIEASAKITAFTVAIASKIINFTAKITDFVNKITSSKAYIAFKASITSFVNKITSSKAYLVFRASITGFLNKITRSKAYLVFKASITSFVNKIAKSKLVLSFTASITKFAGAGYAALKTMLGMKANGGIYSNGKWKPITQYASGGFPDMGQMFIARERGAELVGTLGGHTAVMNNDQIVASVAAGVFEAVTAAMANSNDSGSVINVYVGGQKITDYVIKDVKNRTIASGGLNPLLV